MEKRPEEQIHSLGMDVGVVVPKGKFGTSSTPKVPNHDLGEEMDSFTGRVYVFLPDAPKIHFVKWIK